MDNQSLFMMLAASVLVLVLIAVTILLAKRRSRIFVRLIETLAKKTKPAGRVKISRRERKRES